MNKRAFAAANGKLHAAGGRTIHKHKAGLAANASPGPPKRGNLIRAMVRTVFVFGTLRFPVL